MTRADFDAAVARFREVPGGTVEIKDFFPSGGRRAPYRGAWLKVEVNAVSLASQMDLVARLALSLGCYLTMSVGHRSGPDSDGQAEVSLQATRELDEDEIGDDPPCAIREVP